MEAMGKILASHLAKAGDNAASIVCAGRQRYTIYLPVNIAVAAVND